MSSHSSRGSRVRTKVVALLASLAALWAFAAYVTLRDGTNLLSLTTFASKVGKPLEDLVANLQKERRASLVYLADASTTNREALVGQRALTDKSVTTFTGNISETTVIWLADDALEQRFTEVKAQLTGLPQTRSGTDSGALDRTRAGTAYTGVIDAAFRIYGFLVALDDEDAAKRGRALVGLSRATELLSQEDALLAGALTAGSITPAEHARFVQLVGTQRFLYQEAIADLPAEDQVRYAALAGSQAYREFSTIEDDISKAQAIGAAPTVAVSTWNVTVEPMLAEQRDAILKATDHGLELAKPIAIWVIIRLILAGGLGLLAVVASVVISVTTARALVKQLERLRNAARDLASYRLPRVVQRLQHGEKVDVDIEAPPLDFGNDEIGQVGQAFNDVQSTAIRVAVEQAELRRSVRDVFLSLARRSQALLHRQLGLLDVMERRATDSEELAELFRIDHLATRMRRNAENLIVLSGATAGRAWRRPVPMVDVLRGALAEVEDYTRVTVLPVGNASLVGRAVGDVIHLLAELIENAVSFSPPQTVVRVGGSVVGNGFAIEIEDRGLGMSEEDRALANHQLAEPPEFKLSSTARLGLYVVGKLSERHGIRVRLTESPYGGTTAIVLLPATLMADGGDATDGVRLQLLDVVDPASGDGPRDGTDDAAPDAPNLATWAALTPGRHRNDVLGTVPSQPTGRDTPPDTSTAEPLSAADDDGDIAVDGDPPRSFVTLDTPLAPAVNSSSGLSNGVSNGLVNGSSSGHGGSSNGESNVGSALVEEPSLGGWTSLNTSTVDGSRPDSSRVDESLLDRPDSSPSGALPLVTGSPAGHDAVILTPSGLPFRQRERGGNTPPSVATGAPAHTLAAQPSGPAATPPPAEPVTADPGRASRPPEEVRLIMASYRSGTLRGRIDAARLTDANGVPEWTEAMRDPHRTDEEG